MRIRVMIFSFNAEAKFSEHETFLRDNGVDICAYVSFIDPVAEIFKELQPDIVVYDFGTTRIELYKNVFTCRLLASGTEFNLNDHLETRQLSENRGQNGLNIFGYVENRSDFLLTAIRLVNQGQECFYTNQEMPEL